MSETELLMCLVPDSASSPLHSSSSSPVNGGDEYSSPEPASVKPLPMFLSAPLHFSSHMHSPSHVSTPEAEVDPSSLLMIPTAGGVDMQGMSITIETDMCMDMRVACDLQPMEYTHNTTLGSLLLSPSCHIQRLI